MVNAYHKLLKTILDPNFTSTELEIILNVYKDIIQKKIKNNKLKRRYNAK
jgi:hypothetical protein